MRLRVFPQDFYAFTHRRMTAHCNTIAAIATAPGQAGIAIVRVSGPDSLSIADRLFHGPPPLPSQRCAGSFVRGYVRSIGQPGEPARNVDEVILLIFRAPHSYTREDVIEFHCHGGRISAGRILDQVLLAGARLAEPGEFTRRAFLNGRIDLLQAEAVADLIRAESDRAAEAAVEQLQGALTKWFTDIYNDCLTVTTNLEAMLDFPDDELSADDIGESLACLGRAIEKAKALLVTWKEGHILREGALVVICGPPNVGKSTLLNTLLGKNRAIVSPIPGTTRDTIEESFVLGGFPIRLVDTAGLRQTRCEIEGEGVARATALMGDADVVLYVLEACREIHTEDRERLSRLDPAMTIVALNKSDIGEKITQKDVSPHRAVMTCLLDGRGVSELKDALLECVKGFSHGSDQQAVISSRHKHFLSMALEQMEGAWSILQAGSQDMLILASSSMRQALSHIGGILGRTYTHELLDSIFSRFCIGK